ncbi:TetR/AcrR family transcriptional regulator [Saccharomonospora sp. NPDC006951]
MPAGTRDALVEAAARLLDEGGVAAVTLREVGHRAGVSHNAPYKHFADKRALLAAIAARELAEVGAALSGGIRGGRPAAESLRAALHTYITWALRHPARFKLVFGTWEGAGTAELGAAAVTTQQVFAELVASAQREGGLPHGDPVRLGSLLRALVHGAVDLTLAGHLAENGKGAARPDQLVDDLLGYLATHGEG